MKISAIKEQQRIKSPAVTPQALAWDGQHFWMSSRDLGTLFKIDVTNWKIVNEIDPPGSVWAAVASDGSMYFTIGKGLNDDRYVYHYAPAEGFTKLFACPDLTGSYLSYRGKTLYLSQWYEERILAYNENAKIVREIQVGAEICGHTLVDGMLYVIRGKENKNVPNKSEEWRIARLNPSEAKPVVEDLATIPFAARSLTFDGQNFWSNHRAGNETISFSLPS